MKDITRWVRFSVFLLIFSFAVAALIFALLGIEARESRGKIEGEIQKVVQPKPRSL